MQVYDHDGELLGKFEINTRPGTVLSMLDMMYGPGTLRDPRDVVVTSETASVKEAKYIYNLSGMSASFS